MGKKGQFRLTTKNGYDFFQAASAFQKSIRRGDEKEAFFWAIELYESGYHKYLWKRMIIITSEDIGLAEPSFPAVIIALKESFDYLSKLNDKHKPEKLPFVHCVIALCRARKSRFVDLGISVYWRMHEDEVGTHEVPDYAFDMHTREGRKRGRGLKHFYEEGAKINNTNLMPEEEEFFKLARQIDYENSKRTGRQKEDKPKNKIEERSDNQENLSSRNDLGIF